LKGEFEGAAGGAYAAGEAGGVEVRVGKMVADYLLCALGEACTV
jgi:hypothetical protein